MTMTTYQKAKALCYQYPTFVKDVTSYLENHSNIEHMWFKINMTATEQALFIPLMRSLLELNTSVESLSRLRLHLANDSQQFSPKKQAIVKAILKQNPGLSTALASIYDLMPSIYQNWHADSRYAYPKHFQTEQRLSNEIILKRIQSIQSEINAAIRQLRFSKTEIRMFSRAKQANHFAIQLQKLTDQFFANEVTPGNAECLKDYICSANQLIQAAKPNLVESHSTAKIVLTNILLCLVTLFIGYLIMGAVRKSQGKSFHYQPETLVNCNKPFKAIQQSIKRLEHASINPYDML